LLHLGLSTPFALLSFFIFYFNCYGPLSLFTELIILIKVIFFFQNLFFGKSLSKLSCVCLPLEKLVNEKNFPVKKIWLGFQESVFLENLGRKHFPEVVKNLEMSYYLLIISNLVLKLLIAIYIVLNIYFSISSLKI